MIQILSTEVKSLSYNPSSPPQVILCLHNALKQPLILNTHIHTPGLEKYSIIPLVDKFLIHRHLGEASIPSIKSSQYSSCLMLCSCGFLHIPVSSTYYLAVSLLLLFNNHRNHVYVYMYYKYKMQSMEARIMFRSENESCQRRAKWMERFSVYIDRNGQCCQDVWFPNLIYRSTYFVDINWF